VVYKDVGRSLEVAKASVVMVEQITLYSAKVRLFLGLTGLGTDLSRIETLS
jgi:hypothetical protein